MGSECETSTQLTDARPWKTVQVLREDLAKTCGPDLGVWTTKPVAVKHVEYLAIQAKLKALPQSQVLVHSKILYGQPRVTKSGQVTRRIPKRSIRRIRKTAW